MQTTNFFRFLGISLITLFFSFNLNAQTYPNKPITVIVPFSAGSASDVVTRVLLEKVSSNTNTRFIFDNRPAAGGRACGEPQDDVGGAALPAGRPAGP